MRKERLWRRVLVAVAAVALLLAFPQGVRAGEAVELDVYYYRFDREGGAFLDAETFWVYGGLDEQALLWIRFVNLLENEDSALVPCVSPEARLLGVWLRDGELFVDMSGGILDYGGGTAQERLLIGQLARNAAAVSGADFITLLVDGTAVVWPEGSRTVRLPLAEIADAL